MTVSNTGTGVVYVVTTGEAGQEYPLPFPFLAAEDVRAYFVSNNVRTMLRNGADYGVSGQTMTVSVPLPAGAKLAIWRETPLTQEIDWVDGQAVYTPDIEQADDKLTFIVQEMAGDVERAVKVSQEDAADGVTPEDVLQSVYDARADAATARAGAETARTGAEAALAAAQACRDAACACAEEAEAAKDAAAAARNGAEAARDGAATARTGAEAAKAAAETARGGAESARAAAEAARIGAMAAKTAAETAQVAAETARAGAAAAKDDAETAKDAAATAQAGAETAKDAAATAQAAAEAARIGAEAAQAAAESAWEIPLAFTLTNGVGDCRTCLPSGVTRATLLFRESDGGTPSIAVKRQYGASTAVTLALNTARDISALAGRAVVFTATGSNISSAAALVRVEK